MTEPTCPNLRALAGGRYKVTFDAAYDAYHVPRAKLDPWAMVIPCRHGEIYPFGTDTLAVFVIARRSAAARLQGIPGVTLYTDGDDGKTFTFPAGAFDRVAAVVRPRKRRRMTEGQRRQLAEAGAGTRFHAGHGVQGDLDAPGAHQMPPDDPGPTPVDLDAGKGV
jgi:hypothetical protein